MNFSIFLSTRNLIDLAALLIMKKSFTHVCFRKSA